MELGHAPVVDVLAAPHGIGKMDFPTVTLIHIGQSSSDTSFSHDGMSFSEQALANKTDGNARSGSLDGARRPRRRGADDQDVMLDNGIVSHARVKTLKN